MPWMTFYYFTRDEAIDAALRPGQLEFTPGTQWAYRNINYMLLTRLVEVVSHQSFSAFMHDRIFLPLGMLHSEINDDSTEIIPHRATGYALRSDPRLTKELAQVKVAIKPGDGWVRMVRVAPHFGGSGVFTTLDDLLLWDRNWYSGTVGWAAVHRPDEPTNEVRARQRQRRFRTCMAHPSTVIPCSTTPAATLTFLLTWPAFRTSTSQSSVFRTCRSETQRAKPTRCWTFSTAGASCRYSCRVTGNSAVTIQ